jgi:hypothetical protein
VASIACILPCPSQISVGCLDQYRIEARLSDRTANLHRFRRCSKACPHPTGSPSQCKARPALFRRRRSAAECAAERAAERASGITPTGSARRIMLDAAIRILDVC